MTLTLVSTGPLGTRALGRQMASLLRRDDVLLLSGDLGAGKTEFTKGIAEGLGIAEPVNSPTFNLLLVHGITGDSPELPHSLYHFDLYRLDTADQLEDLDYFGLLEDGAVSVVEWGDRFPEALPYDYMLIEINTLTENSRQFTFTAFGKQSQQRLDAWRALHA